MRIVSRKKTEKLKKLQNTIQNNDKQDLKNQRLYLAIEYQKSKEVIEERKKYIDQQQQMYDDITNTINKTEQATLNDDDLIKCATMVTTAQNKMTEIEKKGLIKNRNYNGVLLTKLNNIGKDELTSWTQEDKNTFVMQLVLLLIDMKVIFNAKIHEAKEKMNKEMELYKERVQALNIKTTFLQNQALAKIQSDSVSLDTKLQKIATALSLTEDLNDAVLTDKPHAKAVTHENIDTSGSKYIIANIQTLIGKNKDSKIAGKQDHKMTENETNETNNLFFSQQYETTHTIQRQRYSSVQLGASDNKLVTDMVANKSVANELDANIPPPPPRIQQRSNFDKNNLNKKNLLQQTPETAATGTSTADSRFLNTMHPKVFQVAVQEEANDEQQDNNNHASNINADINAKIKEIQQKPEDIAKEEKFILEQCNRDDINLTLPPKPSYLGDKKQELEQKLQALLLQQQQEQQQQQQQQPQQHQEQEEEHQEQEEEQEEEQQEQEEEQQEQHQEQRGRIIPRERKTFQSNSTINKFVLNKKTLHFKKPIIGNETTIQKVKLLKTKNIQSIWGMQHKRQEEMKRKMQELKAQEQLKAQKQEEMKRKLQELQDQKHQRSTNQEHNIFSTQQVEKKVSRQVQSRQFNQSVQQQQQQQTQKQDALEPLENTLTIKQLQNNKQNINIFQTQEVKNNQQSIDNRLIDTAEQKTTGQRQYVAGYDNVCDNTTFDPSYRIIHSRDAEQQFRQTISRGNKKDKPFNVTRIGGGYYNQQKISTPMENNEQTYLIINGQTVEKNDQPNQLPKSKISQQGRKFYHSNVMDPSVQQYQYDTVKQVTLFTKATGNGINDALPPISSGTNKVQNLQENRRKAVQSLIKQN